MPITKTTDNAQWIANTAFQGMQVGANIALAVRGARLNERQLGLQERSFALREQAFATEMADRPLTQRYQMAQMNWLQARTKAVESELDIASRQAILETSLSELRPYYLRVQQSEYEDAAKAETDGTVHYPGRRFAEFAQLHPEVWQDPHFKAMREETSREVSLSHSRNMDYQAKLSGVTEAQRDYSELNIREIGGNYYMQSGTTGYKQIEPPIEIKSLQNQLEAAVKAFASPEEVAELERQLSVATVAWKKGLQETVDSINGTAGPVATAPGISFEDYQRGQ